MYPRKIATVSAMLWAFMAFPCVFGFQDIPDTSSVIPEHTLYELLFRKIKILDSLADKNMNAQLESTTLRAYVAKELNITAEEYSHIEHVAQRCLEEVDELDKVAISLIKQIRESGPEDGVLTSLDQLPTIPAELDEMQRQRNEIFINGKHEMAFRIGISRFKEIEQKIRNEMSPRITIKKR